MRSLLLFIGLDQFNWPAVAALSTLFDNVVCTTSSSALGTIHLPTNVDIVYISNNKLSLCYELYLKLAPSNVFSWGSNYCHYVAEILLRSNRSCTQSSYPLPLLRSRSNKFDHLRDSSCFSCSNNIRIPKYTSAHCSDIAIIHAFAKRFKHGVVLKLDLSTGSHRCQLLSPDSGCSFSAVVELLRSSPSDNSDIFVQEYISGDQYSVDAFIADGKVCKCILGNKFMSSSDIFHTQFIDYSHTHSKLESRVYSLVRSLADAFPCESGFLHLELVDQAGFLYLVDIVNRPAGSFATSIVFPFMAGIPLSSLLSTAFNFSSTFLNIGSARQAPSAPQYAKLVHVDLAIYGAYISKINNYRLASDPRILGYFYDASLFRPLANYANLKPRSLVLALGSLTDIITNSQVEEIISEAFEFL